MSDTGTNGGGIEVRVMMLERDTVALAAGDQLILAKVTKMAEDEIERHGEVMRMIGEILTAIKPKKRRR